MLLFPLLQIEKGQIIKKLKEDNIIFKEDELLKGTKWDDEKQ